ncbi:putative electron transfer flavoprotein-ubiquinone oxidoreductase, mitochondrial [Psilocybe cubensis]|uniref:Electron transfer flavoprotein-ubiquinone oxidoreductase, mitochondrial n=3 Tax=Psilocybe cubensis TaxID=181762 RepID=A0ACB8H2N4_PSICU|nr:putative electron transfer flavoprotein-ubiquinone oxidoreductase, mitochondrial [Psilocybe cubensis]XP_047749678.1 putative electron transfer flavoprotein-ubiquinone oxidoreductase, mitochondrial [Psilocybe cubensis]KAH9482048.1 putative electron transfer flavoprotein-ubiquinone oxidoreductase, mitochondrial [Psilocybe cubensis]KAH9482053.1 putative electron transfer flavoprotein-ubiquinone oxidoreductase, mitochondrial [Psilocybe cubensis]
MLFLTPKISLPIPHPPQMSNKGNYVASLSQFTRWLAGVAENKYGVEIYPGFAGTQLLLSDEPDSTNPWGNKFRSVQGVITNEVGLTKNYRMKSSFEPGMAFRAKVTLLAEGAHGSLSKQAIILHNPRKEAEPQTYGIGLKEVWRVDPEKHKPGEVVHMLEWPLDKDTYGGGWVYHMDGGLVSLGLVIGLDYKNPWLSPDCEFQRMKHHPYFRALLTFPKAERLSYAARVLNEGGLQSVPKLNFPGGALVGFSAGFVNIAKIKGTHNAMKSGILAAKAAWNAVHPSEAESSDGTVAAAADMSSSWVQKDLHEVRNLRPSFGTRLWLWGGIIYSGIDSLILKGRVLWTFKHHGPKGKTKNPDSTSSLDSSLTEPAGNHMPIEYPPFEAPWLRITFKTNLVCVMSDILTSLSSIASELDSELTVIAVFHGKSTHLLLRTTN